MRLTVPKAARAALALCVAGSIPCFFSGGERFRFHVEQAAGLRHGRKICHGNVSPPVYWFEYDSSNSDEFVQGWSSWL